MGPKTASMWRARHYDGDMTQALHLDEDSAYRALSARDARFDGQFFVGVTSTGIYCRPVCRVRLPRRENCRFFAHPAAAEQAGFRPCLRCRPEQAPGWSTTDASRSLAQAGARWIDHQVAEGRPVSVPAVAAHLGVSERHLRRIFALQFGVGPLEWCTTQRLLLAKRLLTDTSLPMTEVALASGFRSLRRFNAAFAEHYRLAPSALRRLGSEPRAAPIRLSWRPPYDSEAMRRHLQTHAVPGLEAVDDEGWRRTLALPRPDGVMLSGWIALRWQADGVSLDIAPALAPALGAVVARLRQQLDLDADPQQISAALAHLPVPVQPGLRVAGSMDGFEAAVRIILGQQVSLGTGNALAGRLASAFGAPQPTPWPAVQRLFPDPATLAQASVDALGALGLFRTRAAAVRALAQAVCDGRLSLHPAAPLEATLDALRQLPGVGEWTVQMIALRALAWPDAYPGGDAVLRRQLERTPPDGVDPANAWRPWRAYAATQLWHADAHHQGCP